MQDSVNCPSCQQPNPADGIYCLSCGKHLNMPPAQSSVGYQTPIPPQSPPLKKPKPIALIVVVAVLAVCGVCGFGGYGLYTLGETHSGTFVDGVELTRTQKKDGIKEIENIIKDSRPGKPISEDALKNLKSPLSKKYAGYITELLKGESDIKAYRAKANIDDVLAKSMVVKQNREAAHAAVVDFDKHIFAYFDHQLQQTAEAQRFAEVTLKARDPEFETAKTRIVAIQEAYKTFSTARLKLLDFVRAHPPAALQNDSYLFDKDSDVIEYSKLSKAFLGAAENYDKVYEKN